MISTHLHADHVGWNTTWNGATWVPTFPNAEYLFVESEFAHWSSLPADPPVGHGSYADSVLPIIAAGQSRMIAGTEEIARGVHLQHAPGHTPGTTILKIDDGGRGAAVTGDVFHHPLQLRDPSLSTNFCVDKKLSGETRRAVLESFAAAGTLLFPAHFIAPVAGRAVSDGEGFRFEFLES